MAKIILTFEENFDFFLLAISSHVKDYRISWSINQSLGIDLEKVENLEIKSKNENLSFSLYSYYKEEDKNEYFLIGNRSIKGYLLPEEKQIDFLLQVKGPLKKKEKDVLVEKLGKLPLILKLYELNANQLKSKKNLIF